MKKILALALLTLTPACVSIQTYENQMKRCRDNQQRADQFQMQVTALQEKNDQLEKDLSTQSEEKQKFEGEMTDVRNTYDELVQELKDDIAKGDVDVQETGDGLTIMMGNKILFESGKASLLPKGKKVLSQIAGILLKVKGKYIQVEGHTDNLAIAPALKGAYASNWELSAVRAGSVVRTLEKAGIDPSLLILTGYGQTRPVGDNKTKDGRQQNRRVEIHLIPISSPTASKKR